MPPPNRSPEAYFTNLRDGDTVEAPFVLRFGLSMRGLVPAGKTADRAGQYIHFGKGQMEHVVDLPPGSYTFNLLLADQGHIPYFVFGKPMRLTIARRKSVPLAEVTGAPRVEILRPGPGEAVRTPVRVQFHASGFAISHAGAQAPGTGHFRLTLGRGERTEVMDFRAGQTEAWLQPPQGDYQMKLELVSNEGARNVIAATGPQRLTIAPAVSP